MASGNLNWALPIIDLNEDSMDPFFTPTNLDFQRNDHFERINHIMKPGTCTSVEWNIEGIQTNSWILKSSISQNTYYLKYRHHKKCQYGEIYECIIFHGENINELMPTEQRVAIKVLKKSKIEKESYTDDPLQEILLMEHFHRPGNQYIMTFKEILHDDKHLFVVMDFIQSELYPFPEMDTDDQLIYIVKHLFRQILQGVQYLHNNGYAHLDLTVENILLIGDHLNGKIKIIDFGIMKPNNQLIHPDDFACKPSYRAPEMCRNILTPIEPSPVDMWCCGIILFVLIHQYYPFKQLDQSDLNYRDLVNGNFLADDIDSLGSDYYSLISGLLMINPEHRMTIQQALDHPWLQK